MAYVDKKYLEIGEDMEDANADQENLLSGLPVEALKKLTPAKMQLIDCYLTGNYTYKKLGAMFNIAPSTVKSWLMDENVQAIISELQNRELALMQADLNRLRSRAIETMEDLLDSNMDNIRFSAARDILDRGGLKAEQKLKVDKTVTNLEQTLMDMGNFVISEDEVIDIDISDVLDEVKDDGNN